ncbi:MAG: MmcB family DNA repair protein [Candidatus Heimdallarchaeaceae archaeon]
MSSIKITSKVILTALSYKHSQDVFISECKTGPSRIGALRMDAWVMKKSWASPLTIGYEIKISRGDFLGDNKWRNYLPYCNEFYFVCPSKLIDKNEVPENVGLMYISSTGTRLYTKKKAKYRDVEVPGDLYRYLLMWRTIIAREYSNDMSKKEYWQNWLEQREINSSLGYEVSKQLRKTIDEEIGKVRRVNEDLEKRLERYKYLVEFLERIEVDPKSYYLRGDTKNRLKELKLLIPSDFKWSVIHTKNELDELLEKIEDFEKKEGLE